MNLWMCCASVCLSVTERQRELMKASVRAGRRLELLTALLIFKPPDEIRSLSSNQGHYPKSYNNISPPSSRLAKTTTSLDVTISIYLNIK